MATAITSIDGQLLQDDQAAISPETFSWIFYVLPFVVILAALPQLLWMWNVVTKLRVFVQQTQRLPRLMLFKATWILFLLLIAYLPIYVFNFFVGVFEQVDSVAPMKMVGFVLGVFAIQMVMLFCFLNMIYAVAKTIKTVEESRELRFVDFVGDFFFILFLFPIAIWFIQPRINKIITNDPAEDLSLSNEKVLDL